MARPERHAAGSLRILASPRVRRRIIAGVVALAVVGVVAAALIVGNTAEPPLPLTDRPAIVEQKSEPLQLTAADRESILAVGRQFVRTAVERNHAERAWPLSSTGLREGTTLADWKAGTLPFSPFPVSKARWALAYSVVGEVGLDVLVESEDPTIRPLLHRLTLVPTTRPSGPAWLVDGWTPMASPAVGDDAPFSAAAAATGRTTPPPSQYWILAPFAVLASALLLPLVIIVRSRRAELRVQRRWHLK